MEDPRKRQLRNIMDNVYHLNKRRFFHLKEIDAETKRLNQYMTDNTINHKKYEQLQKIEGLQWMLNQAVKQLKLECEKLQKFLSFNDDLKDIDSYEEAKQLIEAVNDQDEAQAKET